MPRIPRNQVILTDSTYLYNSYSWAIPWSQNDYCSSDGRSVKNEDLLRELMTLRRKLSRAVRIEVKLIPRRSDEGVKEVDRTAKAAGKMPAHIDRGFQRGKIGRPKNNSKSAAKLFPAAGQTLFDKFEAYATNEIGNELRRQVVFHVRMNDIRRYPQIVEIAKPFHPLHFRVSCSNDKTTVLYLDSNSIPYYDCL